jgi:hypothetical protein
MLERASPAGGLQGLLDEVTGMIKKTLFSEACFANQSVPVTRTVNTGGVRFPLFLGPSERIAQVPEIVVKELLGASPYDVVRGATFYDIGKILLSKNQWCIETLIHETLHSLSIFGLVPDIRRRYTPMIEGLTECLTEYMLSANYAGPYNCLRQKNTYCTLTYPYETRIWCALANVIGYRGIASIYFWNKRNDWETLFEEFSQGIRKAGYPKFENVLKVPGKLAPMVRLHQECARAIGIRYGEAHRQVSEKYD